MTKRILALFLSLIMLLNVGINEELIALAASATGEELIVNGGFEDVTDNFPNNWAVIGGTKATNYASDESIKNSGNASLKIMTESKSTSLGVKQEVEVVGGAEYELSAWAYATVDNIQLDFKIECYDENGEWIKQFQQYHYPWGAQINNWAQFKLSFTAPDNCAKAIVIIRTKNSTEMHFDDISLIGPKPGADGGDVSGGDGHSHNGGTATCSSPAICTVCEQPYGEKNASNHTGGEEIKGAKEATATEKGYTGDTYCKGCGEKIATGSEIPATGGNVSGGDAHQKQEFLTNGDLETLNSSNKPTGWSGGVLDTTIKHSGNNSLKLVGDGTQTKSIEHDRITVGSGQTYTVSGYVYPVDLASGKITIQIEYYNSMNWDGYKKEEYYFQEGLTTNQWNLISADITVPDGKTVVLVRFRLENGKEAYFDDLSLVGEELSLVEIKERLKNGDLEEASGNLPKNWIFAGGAVGQNYMLDTTIKHGGNNSLKFVDDGTHNVYASQQFIKVVGDSQYTISGYVYPEDMGTEGRAEIKIEYHDVNGSYAGKHEVSFSNLKTGEWNLITTEFTPPAKVDSVTVLYRLQSGKCAYYDDFSLLGQVPDPTEVRPSTDYVPMPAGSTELLTNTSFEENDGVAPEDWASIGGPWQGNEYISLTDKAPYEGNTAVRINSTTNNNPWIRQVLYGYFRKGEVYQISAWVRKEDAGAFGCKLEFYDKNLKYKGGTNSPYYTAVTGEQWAQVAYHMTIPQDTYKMELFVRMFSTGITDIDNVSLYRIKDAEKISLNTDEIFYYTEEAVKGGLGKAEAFVDTDYDPTLLNASVTFRIKDGDTVIAESKGNAIKDCYATYQFPISLLAEEWKEYTLEAVIVDTEDKEIESDSQSIYKYPRPTMLNEEGRIVLDNGEIFNPTLYYHVNLDQYAKVKAIGGNAVQSNSETLGGILACLDEAQKHGIKVMAALYRDMRPAGHELNVDNTTKIINGVKDHPALLGYMVMDEPSSNWAQHLDVFEDSYKLIRTLDPKHPVYICEAQPKWYSTFSKYVDILAIDPYLQANKQYQVEHVRDYAERATAATQYQKPVWCINQLEKLGTYMPDENGIRNMFYQGLMGGATSIAFFPFYNCYYENGQMVPLDATPNYEILKRFYGTDETVEAYNHFVDRKYPIFVEKNETAYWLSSYVKDNAVYMIAVNNSDTAVECNISLTSDGGAVSIGAYTAEMVYGGTGTVSGNGTLSFELEGDGAYVWKIVPSENTDFTSLKTTKYRDTYQTPWAAEEIRELEAEGIINDWTATSFAPLEKITRAEFAYMFVRALGLSAETTSNFDDVKSDAYYAKELAIGKELGILQSVEDNLYYPEEEISRQEIMAIIARGLELSGAENNQNVGVNIAKGNTTRAEAAVIIKRIMDR